MFHFKHVASRIKESI